MSLADLTSIHTITVQNETVTVGASFGKSHTWADRSPTLTCNFQFLNASEMTLFAARGMKANAMAYFSSNPSITISNRVKYGSRIFRVTGTWSEADGAGTDTVWIVACDEVQQRNDA